MGYFKIILTAVSILIFCGEQAQAQFSTDLCKQANATILLVRLETGFKEVFAL